MTVTVTNAPSTSPPDKYGSDPAAFDAAMQAHLTWMTNAAPELNAQNIENNSINAQVNASKIAAAASAVASATSATASAASANFKGTWSALTGALNMPTSVLHNGQIWQLTANLANVTTAQPGVSSSWYPMVNLDVASRAPIQPTLDLDFANQRYRVFDGALGLKEIALADILTYTGSGRTYTDALGILRAQASNVPRLEFDPVTGAGQGLSVWAARTNLFLNSLISGASLTTQAVTLAAVEHRLSFYGTGTVTLSGAASDVLVGAGAYPVRSGLTFTPTAGSVTFTVTGNVQFSMLTTGNVDSPYIPTVAAAVTAPADVASITGSNFSKWYNQSEGTFVVVARSPADPTNIAGFVAASNSSTTAAANVISLRQQTSLNRMFLNGGGVANVLTASNASALSSVVVAGSYKTDDLRVSANGGVVVTDGTAAMPTIDRLEIGATGDFQYQLNSTISRILYFPRALPAHLQALSA